METFVREAIARAAFESSLAEEGMGTGDRFLEVGLSQEASGGMREYC